MTIDYIFLTEGRREGVSVAAVGKLGFIWKLILIMASMLGLRWSQDTVVSQPSSPQLSTVC